MGQKQSSHKELCSKVSEGTPGKEQLTRPTNEMNERWRVDWDCCLETTARLSMKRECCLEATTASLEVERRSVALRQQLNPQKEGQCEVLTVRTDALKWHLHPNQLLDWKPLLKSWSFWIVRRWTWWEWKEMRNETSLWTWFGLDLILKWMTWWLGGRLIVSVGRDWLSAPRLLQDLMIVELVRCQMNTNQTCECTHSDASHPWW